MDEHNKKFNRVRKIKNQTELRNTISEMKNILGGIKCRLDDTEEQIR